MKPKIIVVKRFICIGIVVFYAISCSYSQSELIAGQWKGLLSSPLGKIELQLIINTDPLSGKLSASSGIQGIALQELTFEKDTFSFTIPLAQIQYKGHFQEGTIHGTWQEGSKQANLIFKRPDVTAISSTKRVQTPRAPFPYTVEEVVIKTATPGIHLSGTLTLPKGEGPFPAAILLTVAGANDRDQTHSLNHKPFWVLADYLSRRGIAVLRCDDRGVGKSGGNLMEVGFSALTTDALRSFQYLHERAEIEQTSIGFIGNSEGTVIGSLAAIENDAVAFVIQLGAVGVPLAELTEERLENMQALYQLTPAQKKEIITYWKEVGALLQTDLHEDQLRVKMDRIRAETTFDHPDFPHQLYFLPADREERINLLLSPWYRAQLNYRPAPVLRQLTCPTLIINGSVDVFQSPQLNFPPIQQALFEAGNEDFSLVVAPQINHIMQSAKSGLPTEYAQLPQSFAPSILAQIFDWLRLRFL